MRETMGCSVVCQIQKDYTRNLHLKTQKGRKSTLRSFWTDNKTIWLNVSLLMNGITARGINYFSRYDIQRASTLTTISWSVCVCFSSGFFPPAFFPTNKTNIHEQVSLSHCLYNFYRDKMQRCELVACIMQRHCNKNDFFFLSMCLVCADKPGIGQRRPKSEHKNSLFLSLSLCECKRVWAPVFLVVFINVTLWRFCAIFWSIIRDGVTCFV